MEPYFFYTFATLTVMFVILMLVQKNPVTSAICLVASFFFLAGLYVLLQAHFVAVLQILVYAGAIMVLFIFVIMLLNLKDEELIKDRLTLARGAVIALGGVLIGYLGYRLSHVNFAEPQKLSENFGSVTAMGEMLFNESYFLPFELTGVLLLVGVIGAIVLGKAKKRQGRDHA